VRPRRFVKGSSGAVTASAWKRERGLLLAGDQDRPKQLPIDQGPVVPDPPRGVDGAAVSIVGWSTCPQHRIGYAAAMPLVQMSMLSATANDDRQNRLHQQLEIQQEGARARIFLIHPASGPKRLVTADEVVDLPGTGEPRPHIDPG
jgi:hypothetical protein